MSYENYNGPEEPEIDDSVDIDSIADPNGDPADIDWDDPEASAEATADY